MSSGETFSAFLRLGIEHILLGFDHLLFLGGLLLVARGWRQLVMVVTTFTLAREPITSVPCLSWPIRRMSSRTLV